MQCHLSSPSVVTQLVAVSLVSIFDIRKLCDSDMGLFKGWLANTLANDLTPGNGA